MAKKAAKKEPKKAEKKAAPKKAAKETKPKKFTKKQKEAIQAEIVEAQKGQPNSIKRNNIARVIWSQKRKKLLTK